MAVKKWQLKIFDVTTSNELIAVIHGQRTTGAAVPCEEKSGEVVLESVRDVNAGTYATTKG